jgi:hypothetical protein
MNVKSWIGHTLSLIFCATCETLCKNTGRTGPVPYLLPRLSGMWTHLERQGGIGMRGPGETENSRQRIVRDRISIKD